MKKIILTTFAIFALTSIFAQSDNDNDNRRMGWKKGFKRSLNVDVQDSGKNFQINVKTKADMPSAGDLEISSISVLRPTGEIPGMLNLTLRPAGDAQVAMVGPQKGSYTFAKGTLPNGLPMGRYLTFINGEIYGLLVVGEDKVALLQRLKQPKGNAEEAPMEQPAAATAQ